MGKLGIEENEGKTLGQEDKEDLSSPRANESAMPGAESDVALRKEGEETMERAFVDVAAVGGKGKSGLAAAKCSDDRNVGTGGHPKTAEYPLVQASEKPPMVGQERHRDSHKKIVSRGEERTDNRLAQAHNPLPRGNYDAELNLQIQPLPVPERTGASVRASSEPGAYAHSGRVPYARQGYGGPERPYAEPPGGNAFTTTTTSGGLIVANPVQSDLPRAHRWNETKNSESTSDGLSRKLISAVLFCFLLVLTVAILAFLLVPRAAHTSSQNDDEGNGIGKGQTPEEYLVSILPDYTLQSIEEDFDSPQAKAFQWLLEDPGFPSYPSWRAIQRFSLATVYFATGGNSTSGWVKDEKWISHNHHECDWYGNPNALAAHALRANDVAYDKRVCTAGKYNYLSLFSNRLEGTLPLELFLLTSISFLTLRSNRISGTLSSHIGLLSNLQLFELSGNAMKGTLPSQLGLLTQLLAVGLSFNQFGGTLPTEISKLASMKLAGFEQNQITGPLPSELSTMSSLEVILIHENAMTGTIPTQLALLAPHLNKISLSENLFSGPIPTEVGIMSRLDLISFGGGTLSGTLPTELGEMWSLEFLGVYDTNIGGAIPSQLGQLSLIMGIIFQKNSLTGTLPSELFGISSLLALFASNNGLSGPVPTEMLQLRSLQAVVLRDNFLSSTIPARIESTKLETLDLSNNQLSGSIPSQLGLISVMQELRLENNRLTGKIPTELGRQFQTSFSWIATLVNAEGFPEAASEGAPTLTMSLANNTLTGTIPSQLGLLRYLKHLSLAGNELTGLIPEQLGMISGLVDLRLANNTILGRIPEGLCGLEPSDLAFDCGQLCGCSCSCP